VTAAGSQNGAAHAAATAAGASYTALGFAAAMARYIARQDVPHAPEIAGTATIARHDVPVVPRAVRLDPRLVCPGAARYAPRALVALRRQADAGIIS